MAGETINVNDQLTTEASDQIINDQIMVTGGIGDMLDVIRKLLTMNIITDALKLMDMWQNDNKFTLHDFKQAVRDALAKLGILSDGQPVAPKLKMGDEVDVRVGKIKKPSSADVMTHLRAKGVNVTALPSSMIAGLIQLAIRYGLPLIETLVDLIVQKQSAHERLSWGALSSN